jgi:hypothetical protein
VSFPEGEFMRRHWSVLFALIALLGSAGCQILEETWKYNRGPAMDQGDVYFSVSDPDATFSPQD